MNLKQLAYKLSTLCCVLALLTSCGEDRTHEIEELTEVQHWIYNTMDEWYYWYDELPAKDQVKFTDKPKSFFQSLLNKKDGGDHGAFSYLEDSSEIPTTRSIHQTQYSYGIAFTPIAFNKEQTKLGAYVNYIASDSPASEAGLQRGDIILSTEENEQYLNQEEIMQLIGGPTLSKVSYIRPPLNNGNTKIHHTTLASARPIVDKPTYLVENFENQVGYLVYNHFTPGNVDKDKQDLSYNHDLYEKIASRLVGTKDLILDLRYNNGGHVSCAELLMALIGPSEIIDQSVGYMKYNNKKLTEDPKKYKPLIYATTIHRLEDSKSFESARNHINLNIERLFVITSQNTASASELIINSLSSYIPVYVIGKTTVGKNVGSIGFDKDNWHLQPIVCQIYNNNDFTEYQQGFKPGIYYKDNHNPKLHPEWEMSEIDELFDHNHFGQLGDPNEPLLNTVIRIIANEEVTKEKNTRSTSTPAIKVYPMVGLYDYSNTLID